MSMNEKGGALKGSNPDFQDDQTSKDLNAFVQGLLKQMQDRFEEMSGNITDRIDEMGKKIDEIERSVNDLMNDIGIEELENNNQA